MLTFRHALPEDIAPAIKILFTAYTPIYEGFREQMGNELFNVFFGGWEGPKEERITKMISGIHGYAALLDGQVAGLGHWWPVSGSRTLAALSENAVAADLRGRGLGREIHEHLMDRMREEGFTHVRVGTGLDPAHAAARRAYAKVGFEKGLPNIDYYAAISELSSGSDPHIRPVREEDFPRITEIALVSWDEIHRIYAEEHLGQTLHDAVFSGWQDRLCADLRIWMQKGYVYELDGKIVGFVSYMSSGKYANLGYNAVDPAMRGHGIAGKMYAYAFDRMREEGLGYVTVHTGLDSAHAAARHSYEKAGFGYTIPHIDYYRAL